MNADEVEQFTSREVQDFLYGRLPRSSIRYADMLRSIEKDPNGQINTALADMSQLFSEDPDVDAIVGMAIERAALPQGSAVSGPRSLSIAIHGLWWTVWSTLAFSSLWSLSTAQLMSMPVGDSAIAVWTLGVMLACGVSAVGTVWTVVYHRGSDETSKTNLLDGLFGTIVGMGFGAFASVFALLSMPVLFKVDSPDSLNAVGVVIIVFFAFLFASAFFTAGEKCRGKLAGRPRSQAHVVGTTFLLIIVPLPLLMLAATTGWAEARQRVEAVNGEFSAPLFVAGVLVGLTCNAICSPVLSQLPLRGIFSRLGVAIVCAGAVTGILLLIQMAGGEANWNPFYWLIFIPSAVSTLSIIEMRARLLFAHFGVRWSIPYSSLMWLQIVLWVGAYFAVGTSWQNAANFVAIVFPSRALTAVEVLAAIGNLFRGAWLLASQHLVFMRRSSHE